jgi:hypothetical protein
MLPVAKKSTTAVTVVSIADAKAAIRDKRKRDAQRRKSNAKLSSETYKRFGQD